MNILEHKKTVNWSGMSGPGHGPGTVRNILWRSCSKYQIEIEKEMVLTVKMVGDSLLTV